MVASTSLKAYMAIKPKLGDRQQQVYDAIADIGVATNEQIAEYLKLPLQSITGRVTELRQYGMVGIEGIGLNRSGKSAKKWGIRDANDKTLLDMANDCE